MSGCVGSRELAHFLRAGEECVKVGGVGGVAVCVHTYVHTSDDVCVCMRTYVHVYI